MKFLNSFNLEIQLKNTKTAIKNKPINLLPKLICFEFVTKLVLEFKRMESDDIAFVYSNLKTETVISESDIDDVFVSI